MLISHNGNGLCDSKCCYVGTYRYSYSSRTIRGFDVRYPYGFDYLTYYTPIAIIICIYVWYLKIPIVPHGTGFSFEF